MDPQTGLQGFEVAQRTAATSVPSASGFLSSLSELWPFAVIALPGCWIRFYKLGRRGVVAFMMSNLTAAFTAYLACFVLLEFHASQWLMAAVCGMSGYSGGALLDAAMRRMIGKVEGQSGESKEQEK